MNETAAETTKYLQTKKITKNKQH